jgi:hypothetical protein
MSDKPVGSGWFSLAFGVLLIIGLVASFVVDLAAVNPNFYVRAWLTFAGCTLTAWGVSRIRTGRDGDYRIGQETINFVVAIVGATVAILELFKHH